MPFWIENVIYQCSLLPTDKGDALKLIHTLLSFIFWLIDIFGFYILVDKVRITVSRLPKFVANDLIKFTWIQNVSKNCILLMNISFVVQNEIHEKWFSKNIQFDETTVKDMYLMGFFFSKCRCTCIINFFCRFKWNYH